MPAAPRRLRAVPAITWLAVLLALSPAGARAQEPAVPLARDATAKAIIDAALRTVAARQRESGVFSDPTGRTVGGEGLPSLAFVALARAREDGQEPARPSETLLTPQALDPAQSEALALASSGLTTTAPEDPGSWRLTLARRTLAQGSGTSVILRWPLAMLLADHLEELLVGSRGALRDRVRRWGRLHAAGIAGAPAAAADVCYQRPSCFNNYKLADAVLNLELLRSEIRSAARRTRLYDRVLLRRNVVRFLAVQLPVPGRATGTLTIPGRGSEPAAILSDPSTRPLAYAALCTAWAVRATRLLGRSAPAALRQLTRNALRGLLGATAPDGDVSWSGRGQGQAWTHASSLYAAAAGAALFADTDPLLAARLRRLADLQLAALQARMRDDELQVLPSGNDELAGLDHYYSVVGSTGLALTFLQMARAELPGATAPRLALPAEIDGASLTDPGRETGLVTRRSGLTWMALRMRRNHVSDPRGDAGLVRAMRLTAGRWREQLPARPGPVAAHGGAELHSPSGGPVLVLGPRHYQPRAASRVQLAGGVELRGVWQPPRGGPVAGTWRYSGTKDGVALRSACPSGARLELTVWLPRRGRLTRSGGFLERAGYGVRVSPRPKIRTLATRWANSVQPGLSAHRIVVSCSQPSATVTWSGGAATPADPPTAPVPATDSPAG